MVEIHKLITDKIIEIKYKTDDFNTICDKLKINYSNLTYKGNHLKDIDYSELNDEDLFEVYNYIMTIYLSSSILI